MSSKGYQGPKDMRVFTIIVKQPNNNNKVETVWVHQEQKLKDQWPTPDQPRYLTLFDERVDHNGEPCKFENVDSKKLPRRKVTLRWCPNRSTYIPIKEWYAERKAEYEFEQSLKAFDNRCAQ